MKKTNLFKVFTFLLATFLVVSCSKDPEVFNGKDGKDGKDGINGVNGKDGKDGKDADQSATRLILSGEITDAQAKALIKEKVGKNTTEISIINTTNLTTVEFPNLTKLYNIEIENNAKLTQVSFNKVQEIYKNSTIRYNDVLKSVNYPVLETVGGFNLYRNKTLETLTVPKLKNIYQYLYIQYTSLKSIDFSSITNSITSDAYIIGNPKLTTLKLGFTRSRSMYINNNALLKTAEFPNLSEAFSIEIHNNDVLTQINLASLTKATGKSPEEIRISNNKELNSLNLNSLETVLGTLSIGGGKLTTVSLPKLKQVGGGYYSINIATPLLKSVSFPMLSSFGTRIFIGNTLTQADVDNVLKTLAGITPAISGKQIIIKGATPSQVGNTYLTTLRSNNNVHLYN